MSYPTQLTRIEKILDHIHNNLDKNISVSDLAQISCWSRWQFQRVFNDATGLSVAQYVRELRLSLAAEELLRSNKRHLDIALEYGFESEISFSRSFKKMFGSSPKHYRQAGVRRGLKTPIRYSTPVTPQWMEDNTYPQVRIESKESFSLYGVHNSILGLFSNTPNFIDLVPKIWKQFYQGLTQNQLSQLEQQTKLGIIDAHNTDSENKLSYWAGIDLNQENREIIYGDGLTNLAKLDIPSQEYAVISVKGQVSKIEPAIKWFIFHWLPNSDYRGINGFEIELYPPNYNPSSSTSHMEYWLPIQHR